MAEPSTGDTDSRAPGAVALLGLEILALYSRAGLLGGGNHSGI